ncbi:hypothetical protein ABIF44_004201 [Bradyrhizobium japonicum]|nr:hypothetical protein [Bradyrhizobium japonicum]
MINEQGRIHPDDEGRLLCGDETAGGQSPRSKASTIPVLLVADPRRPTPATGIGGVFSSACYKPSTSDTVKYELDSKGGQNNAGKPRQHIGSGSLQHPVQDVGEDHPEVR